MHDKAGVMRHWRGLSAGTQKRTQEQTKEKKKKSTKDRQNTLIRCPGSTATAERSSRERTWHFVFITVLPSLGITQISLDILTDEPGNKGTELLTC